ncbi:hypothetical protein [Microcoleus sp. CAWBG58]|uniref:hypothetical protein n=1 Tax=Microcoleus sp. CAWBG58 TaxID=2841651 RepID=UPI0025DF9437|nr:hypothetical protein [Microcoleus sp. CAWBG58]
MAIDKPLTAFFGAGATQTATAVTFSKADLRSLRTPPAFTALAPAAVNNAESVVLALLMKTWEEQDTSQDSQLSIFGPEVSLVEVISDGVAKPFEQYVFQVRVLVPRGIAMPNPNSI